GCGGYGHGPGRGHHRRCREGGRTDADEEGARCGAHGPGGRGYVDRVQEGRQAGGRRGPGGGVRGCRVSPSRSPARDVTPVRGNPAEVSGVRVLPFIASERTPGENSKLLASNTCPPTTPHAPL